MGRPPKPKGERRDLPMKVMVTAMEKKALTDAAKGDFSTWARAVLLKAAGHKRPEDSR